MPVRPSSVCLCVVIVFVSRCEDCASFAELQRAVAHEEQFSRLIVKFKKANAKVRGCDRDVTVDVQALALNVHHQDSGTLKRLSEKGGEASDEVEDEDADDEEVAEGEKGEEKYVPEEVGEVGGKGKGVKGMRLSLRLDQPDMLDSPSPPPSSRELQESPTGVEKKKEREKEKGSSPRNAKKDKKKREKREKEKEREREKERDKTKSRAKDRKGKEQLVSKVNADSSESSCESDPEEPTTSLSVRPEDLASALHTLSSAPKLPSPSLIASLAESDDGEDGNDRAFVGRIGSELEVGGGVGGGMMGEGVGKTWKDALEISDEEYLTNLDVRAQRCSSLTFMSRRNRLNSHYAHPTSQSLNSIPPSVQQLLL